MRGGDFWVRRQCKWYALFAVCMLFWLQACGDGRYKTDITKTPTQSPTSTIVPTVIPHVETNVTVPLTNGEMRELQIYTLSVDLENVEAVTALVSAEGDLTPEIIIEVVLEAMADAAYFVEVLGISIESDMIIVDFCKEAPPVTNINHEVENAILDAIGQSLLDNLPAYNRIGYSVEGDAYQTKNIELALGESYIER